MKNKKLTLVSQGIRVVFDAREQSNVEAMEGEINLYLSQAAAADLSSKLLPRAGICSIVDLKGLVIRIVPTHIKDQDGNVVQTIG